MASSKVLVEIWGGDLGASIFFCKSPWSFVERLPLLYHQVYHPLMTNIAIENQNFYSAHFIGEPSINGSFSIAMRVCWDLV